MSFQNLNSSVVDGTLMDAREYVHKVNPSKFSKLSQNEERDDGH
jgi:hypothetical protein